MNKYQNIWRDLDSKKIQLSNGKDMWLYSRKHIKQIRNQIYN